MQKKTVHIVFQVMNYLTASDVKRPKLLPIDKLILLALASHKGARGIFPMQETLADELETSLRYIKTRLKYLEKTGLILIEKINRKNYYHLPFLSTAGDPQITYHESTGDLQITSQVIHRSPHRGSTDATNNKVSNKLNNIERGNAARPSSLSHDFKPEEQSCQKAKELGLSEDEANFEFDKFVSYFQASGKKKANWQKVLQTWFIRAAEYKSKRGNEPTKQLRSMVKDFVPDSRFDRGTNREVAAQALGQIFDKLKGGKGHHGK